MLLGRIGRRLVLMATASSASGPLPSANHQEYHHYRTRSPPPSASFRCLCRSSAASTTSRMCWKCSKQLRRPKRLFCECGVVQSPEQGLNHYELLLGGGDDGDDETACAVTPSYRVDPGKLARAMRRLQWQLHPDKFSHASEEERSLAQQQSARVNDAYRCLSDPVQRAVYLLGLRGIPVPTEESGGSGGGEDLSLPQEFLAEMLELNEALMEADRTAIGQLSERVDADTKAVTDELARAFDSGNLALAKELTYRLRYFANIRAKIRDMT